MQGADRGAGAVRDCVGRVRCRAADDFVMSRRAAFFFRGALARAGGVGALSPPPPPPSAARRTSRHSHLSIDHTRTLSLHPAKQRSAFLITELDRRTHTPNRRDSRARDDTHTAGVRRRQKLAATSAPGSVGLPARQDGGPPRGRGRGRGEHERASPGRIGTRPAPRRAISQRREERESSESRPLSPLSSTADGFAHLSIPHYQNHHHPNHYTTGGRVRGRRVRGGLS